MSRYNLVFHVDTADNAMNVAFKNYFNYAVALEGQSYSAVLVVNAAGVNLLKATNAELKETVEKAAAQGLSIRACNNALVANKIKPEELFPQCSVVPAGIVEIVDLQHEGYAYIKP